MPTRRTARPRAAKHLFREDADAMDPTRKWCLDCPLPELNDVHDVPQTTDEQREHEARKVGDR